MQLVNEELFRIAEDDFGQTLTIDWTYPQSQFLQSTCTYPLFVGGFGSGKSTTMAGAMFEDLIKYPGANIAGYAPTYDLLTLITIPGILEFLDAADMTYDYNKSRYIIEVDGFGMLIFRSLDNPKRIVGYKTLRAHIDELDTLAMQKAEEAWNKIVARNRQLIRLPDGTHAKNRVSAYTTPEGYVFCYDRWIKNKQDGYEYFKAPTRSNPHLPSDYIDNLKRTYPASLVQAYLDGDFVNLTSTNCYREFDRKLNASSIKPNAGEHLHIGMDFNIEHMAAVIHIVRGDTIHAIDEIHDAHDTDDVIRIINDRYPDNPIHVYPDASSDQRSTANSSPTKTDQAKLVKAGFVLHVDFTNPRIRDRVDAVNAKLCNGEGKRTYFININKCPNLVQTLEQQTWDKNGVPDKSTGLDHIGDAMGYTIYKLFPIKRNTAGFGGVHQRRRT